ncbi:MAG: CBS domain-containing protein [Planctomycetota bacterium]|jgi:CBS domain-containing protein
MLKAKDIMTTEVVSVRRDAPVEEALELLLENQIAGIPVVEEDMTLVGIVTEKDLLGLFYEPERRKKKTAEDFMTRPAVHFDEDDNLEDICKCLLEVTFRRVPVTKEGRVVGIVSRPDVLRCVQEQMGREANV